MSAEPGNLMGLNAFKYSGLANRKVLDVKALKTGEREKILLTTSHKVDSRLNRPTRTFLQTGLAKNTKKGLIALEKKMKGGLYRKDLFDLAQKKFKKIKDSFKKKKWVIKSRRVKK